MSGVTDRDRELADAALAHAAERFAAAAARVRAGQSSPAALRDRRADLQQAARAWAAAHGWTAPPIVTEP